MCGCGVSLAFAFAGSMYAPTLYNADRFYIYIYMIYIDVYKKYMATIAIPQQSIIYNPSYTKLAPAATWQGGFINGSSGGRY